MPSYSDRPWLKHYDYWVPHHMAYPRRPLCEILDSAVIDVPDRPATSFFGATLTFQELKDRSDRFATALSGFGIAKGDRVGIMLPNCPQYIIAAFAVLRHGAVVVNINPTYTAREVLTVAGDSNIRVLVTMDVLAPLIAGIRTQTSIEKVVVTSLAEYTPAAAPPPRIEGTLALTELIQGVPTPQVLRVPIAADDLAVL